MNEYWAFIHVHMTSHTGAITMPWCSRPMGSSLLTDITQRMKTLLRESVFMMQTILRVTACPWWGRLTGREHARQKMVLGVLISVCVWVEALSHSVLWDHLRTGNSWNERHDVLLQSRRKANSYTFKLTCVKSPVIQYCLPLVLCWADCSQPWWSSPCSPYHRQYLDACQAHSPPPIPRPAGSAWDTLNVCCREEL